MDAIPTETRALALRLEDLGLCRADVARALGISRSSISRWRGSLEPRGYVFTPCWRCSEPPTAPAVAAAYLYLLGQYLGDGHVAPTGRGTSRSQVLRIYGDNAWPGLHDEVAAALAAVLPVKVFRTSRRGCTAIEAISVHWRCLLPQHGPGKKHLRRIELTTWQQELVRADPRPLIRGLLHSDGCRTVNRVTTRGRRYAYARYFFVNESQDILGIFTDSLDLLGIPWRRTKRSTVSIARLEGVSALDAFVGPKY